MADDRIEIDSVFEVDDGSSGTDDQVSIYTESVAASLAEYPVEYGRRYHKLKSGAYPLPNDEREAGRLDLMHMLITKCLDERLYLSPIQKDKIRHILDLGTGTGLWAMEMGEMFPEAKVIGNDLSPIQPAWVPANVSFEVDDMESEWTHGCKFDFIFCRYLAACIFDWPSLIQKMFEFTAPGGWVEIQDFDLLYYSDDDTFHPGLQTHRWITTLLEASERAGREPRPGCKLERWVKDVGFRDVQVRKLKLPIGIWPKEARLKEFGKMNLAQVLDGLEGFSFRLFCGVLGWSEEELTSLIEKVREELFEGMFHAQFDCYIVYGQKPE